MVGIVERKAQAHENAILASYQFVLSVAGRLTQMILIQSPRLQLSQFQMMDAEEVFGCITPAIAKFMPWEPPSWSEYVTRCEKRVQAPEPNQLSFVIRRLDSRE